MRRPPHLLVALITAFQESGELALDDHAHNVGHLMQRGVEGFLVGGSAGEGPYLESDERRLLVAGARGVAGGEAYIIGATAAQSTRQASRQVAEIADGGADAALVVTPTTLVRGNQVAIHRFYTEVADASPIPTLLGSVPRVNGYELPVDVVAGLAAHPNIIGMKDDGGRPYRMQEVARNVDPGFMQFGAASATIAPSLAAGAFGAITDSTNYLPEQIDYLVASARHAEPGVDAQQSMITAITKVVEAHGVVGTKAAAVMSGMRSSSVRRPLLPLDSAAVAAIRAAISTPV